MDWLQGCATWCGHPSGLDGRLGRDFSFTVIEQGSLKDTFCSHWKHGLFNTKIQGHQHVQGNVQVNNVRIPVEAYFEDVNALVGPRFNLHCGENLSHTHAAPELCASGEVAKAKVEAGPSHNSGFV